MICSVYKNRHSQRQTKIKIEEEEEEKQAWAELCQAQDQLELGYSAEA